jgi:hypothetical protein
MLSTLFRETGQLLTRLSKTIAGGGLKLNLNAKYEVPYPQRRLDPARWGP